MSDLTPQQAAKLVTDLATVRGISIQDARDALDAGLAWETAALRARVAELEAALDVAAERDRLRAAISRVRRLVQEASQYEGIGGYLSPSQILAALDDTRKD